MKRKVLQIPEEQFMGALERQLDRLSDEVVDALATSERGRDIAARADELIARLQQVKRGVAPRPPPRRKTRRKS